MCDGSQSNAELVETLLSAATFVADQVDWIQYDRDRRKDAQRLAARLAAVLTVEDTSGLGDLADVVYTVTDGEVTRW